MLHNPNPGARHMPPEGCQEAGTPHLEDQFPDEIGYPTGQARPCPHLN